MPNKIMKFDYNSSHNNFPAIESLNPIDIGTERQFRFTAKMLCDMFQVTKTTVYNRIETLVSTGDLSVQNFEQTNLPDSRGSLHETTIYDLTVLNKLAMTMIDNHDLLLLNISKAKTPEERALAISELEQYHEDEKHALKADNETLTQEREIDSG